MITLPTRPSSGARRPTAALPESRMAKGGYWGRRLGWRCTLTHKRCGGAEGFRRRWLMARVSPAELEYQVAVRGCDQRVLARDAGVSEATVSRAMWGGANLGAERDADCAGIEAHGSTAGADVACVATWGSANAKR